MKAFVGVEGLIRAMKRLSKNRRRLLFQILIAVISAALAHAQTCFTSADMDEPTRAALQSTGQRYFDMVSRGDSASLKQNAIPSLASDF